MHTLNFTEAVLENLTDYCHLYMIFFAHDRKFRLSENYVLIRITSFVKLLYFLYSSLFPVCLGMFSLLQLKTK